MKNKQMLMWTLLVFLTLLAWGCGSSRDSSGTVSGSADDVLANAATLGLTNCLTCHQGGTVALLVADDWANGVHGNPDASPNNLTNPDCLACHDPLLDGDVVTPSRPVVSCEACHGGGQFHNGIASGVPYPQPGSDRCGQCHNAGFPHGFRPEGKSIAEDYDASPHARSLNDNVFVSGTTDVRARCSKCHSDEGAKLYIDVNGDYSFLSTNLPNTLPPLTGASEISCRTCHTAHNESQLLVDASTGRSAQFNTCTICHQLLEAGSTAKITAYHDPAANPFGALNEIITDTHYAEPGDYPGGSFRGANQSDIVGYAMDFADVRACLNCHNPHNADKTINEQWAASKHADTSAAGAWAHYNWTETGAAGEIRVDGSATSDRTSCQRCHTARGYIKMATETLGDTTAYVPFDDYQANYKPEMLHCNGCHTNSVGGLRNVGPVSVQYTNVPTVTTYPDADESNICLGCHTGRESGESVKNSPADFTNTGFINSHYLTGGGTVYKLTGYEYDIDGNPLTDDYPNPVFYAHDQIGTPAEPGTGDKGPCAGCHLSALDSHSFQPVAKDAGGVITEITSTVCSVCHAGQFELTPAELMEQEEGLHTSLAALEAQLAAVGHPFLGGYPYFATGDWTNAGVYDGMELMGAAFNFNLLEHDPGAYAHNRFYSKRLIYDSIDYIDNQTFDESVGAAIDALVTAGDLDAATAALAKAYLDADSGTPEVERP